MSDRKKRIAVIGAGAIGAVSAAFMTLKGFDVALITKHQELADRINEKGVQLRGIRGDFSVRLKAFAAYSDMDFEPDVIFHATKAYDLSESLKELKTRVPEKTILVSMQNGMCEDEFMEVFGPERVIGCVVGWGSTYIDNGVYEMTTRGEFVIGAFHEAASVHLNEIRDMLNSVFPVSISSNMRGYLYSKLIINSAITSLGLISGMTLGQMLKKRGIRKLFIRIMKEAMGVAAAMGLRVEPYTGKLDYTLFLDDSQLIQRLRQHLIIRIIGYKYRRLHSSAQQSLERGRPTEIPWLNGYIVRNAEKYGVQASLNGAVIRATEEIASGQRKWGPESIKSLIKDFA